MVNNSLHLKLAQYAVSPNMTAGTKTRATTANMHVKTILAPAQRIFVICSDLWLNWYLIKHLHKYFHKSSFF